MIQAEGGRGLAPDHSGPRVTVWQVGQPKVPRVAGELLGCNQKQGRALAGPKAADHWLVLWSEIGDAMGLDESDDRLGSQLVDRTVGDDQGSLGGQFRRQAGFCCSHPAVEMADQIGGVVTRHRFGGNRQPTKRSELDGDSFGHDRHPLDGEVGKRGPWDRPIPQRRSHPEGSDDAGDGTFDGVVEREPGVDAANTVHEGHQIGRLVDGAGDRLPTVGLYCRVDGRGGDALLRDVERGTVLRRPALHMKTSHDLLGFLIDHQADRTTRV